MTFLTFIKKQIHYKTDKLKRALKQTIRWPGVQRRKITSLFKTMGLKGVFWYMLHQGRWPLWLGWVLSIAGVFGLYIAVSTIINAQNSIFLKGLAVGLIGFSFLGSYSLWRSAALRPPSVLTYSTRLYTGSIMLITAIFSLFLLLLVVQKIVTLVIGGL